LGKLTVLEVDVHDLIASTQSTSNRTLKRIAAEAEKSLKAGKDTLVMTSRKLIIGDDELSSLAIGTKVAEALVSVLKQIEVRPRFIIAKVSNTIGSSVCPIFHKYPGIYLDTCYQPYIP
jgi:uncharacterized protein YgbK (DUF1537 family)